MLLKGPNQGPALLSADIGTYTSLLLEVVAKCEDAYLILKESSVTVEILKKEKGNIMAKIDRLKEESDIIYEQSQIISESYKVNPAQTTHSQLSYGVENRENENTTLLASTCLQLQVREQVQVKEQERSLERSQEASAHSTAIEQRVSLMRCVEDLYQQAVITQSTSRREQDSIKVATKQATVAYTTSEARVTELNKRIEELKRNRAVTEDDLKQYTQSVVLQDMQNNLMATIDYHDRMMINLSDDKKHFSYLLEQSVKVEEDLSEEINYTRKEIFAFQKRQSKVLIDHFVSFDFFSTLYLLFVHLIILFLKMYNYVLMRKLIHTYDVCYIIMFHHFIDTLLLFDVYLSLACPTTSST